MYLNDANLAGYFDNDVSVLVGRHGAGVESKKLSARWKLREISGNQLDSDSGMPASLQVTIFVKVRARENTQCQSFFNVSDMKDPMFSTCRYN